MPRVAEWAVECLGTEESLSPGGPIDGNYEVVMEEGPEREERSGLSLEDA